MPAKLPPFPATVPEYTRAVQDYFLRTDPRTGELVTSDEQAERLGLQRSATFVYPNHTNYPAQTLALLKYFDRIDAKTAAKLAASKAKSFFGDFVSLSVPILTPLVALGFFDDTGPTRENISTALARWTERKQGYRERTKAWQAADPDPLAKTAEHAAYGVEVAGPLFLGWYPDRPQQTTLDAVTPLVLARMLGVAQASMAQAWDQLVRDLTLADTRDKLKPDRWPWWLPWLAGGVGVAALAGVGYAVVSPALAARRDAQREPRAARPGRRPRPARRCEPDEQRDAFAAKGRARKELQRWKDTNGAKGLSPAAYRKVVDEADRVIRPCERM